MHINHSAVAENKRLSGDFRAFSMETLNDRMKIGDTFLEPTTMGATHNYDVETKECNTMQ